MRPVCRCAVFSLFGLLATTARAQTIIVDGANGPGTNFTTIQPAVDAAPSGARILVRAGTYAGFTVAGKGIQMLCDQGVLVYDLGSTTVTIRNVPGNEPFVMHGGGAIGSAALYVQDCAGPVILEDVLGFSILALRCGRLMVRQCTTNGGSAVDSNTVFESCQFNGANGQIGHGGYVSRPVSALTLVLGTAQLVDCRLRGGFGISAPAVVYGDAPGLVTNGCAVRVLGASTIASGQLFSVPGASAIVGTGTVRMDPAVVLTASGSPVVDPRITVQVAPMPVVHSRSAGPGGTMVGEALGPAGNLVVLLLGLPGAPLAVPGIADAFWIDPAAYMFAAVGVPQPNQPVTASVVLPNVAALRGQRLAWQSVTPSGAGLEASNPSFSLVD